jgi:hypothetical protein
MIVFRCEIFDNVSQSPTKQRSFRWTISARPLDRASTGQCQKFMKLISTPADASKVTTRLLNHLDDLLIGCLHEDPFVQANPRSIVISASNRYRHSITLSFSDVNKS